MAFDEKIEATNASDKKTAIDHCSSRTVT